LLKLRRDVGLVGASAYIMGTIIGAGIYVILGKAAAITGPSVWLAFLVAALIAACTGLSYAELSSAFPYDSAEYFYTERAFKDRRFSFGIGWLKLVVHVIATSAVALGFGGYLASLTGINFIVCALLLIFILTLINLIGVKLAVRFDIIMVLIAIIGLLLIVGFGLPHIQAPDFYLETASGIPGIITAAALVFFAFLGFENIGNISEEVRDPKRTLPRALIISIIVSTLLYVIVAIIAVSVVPWNELGQSASPLADVMAALLGSKAGVLIAIMALAATCSTVLGLMIGTSRMAYGMAEERSLPRFLSRVSRKQRVPYMSIIIVGIACALFALPGDIKAIAFLTDFGALFLFMVVNLCLIVLRYSHQHVPRTFRIPLNIGKFPVIPAVGLLACTALLFSFSKKMFFAGIMMFLLGILLYTIFWERKATEHRENQRNLAREDRKKREAKKASKTKVKRKKHSAKKK
jgi:APA family basic amino acid/polyamine antiporter